MPEKALPKGFKCECGEEHNFSSYVYAHWTIHLKHECPVCNRKHNIYQGRATLINEEPHD